MCKPNTLILIMTLLSLLWGIGYLVFPVQMWALYGIALDSGGIYMSRELGTIFFMLGLILWLARNDPGSQSFRAIVIDLFVGNLIGFIVSLIGQFSAGVSAPGWVGVASYLLLALGFGYCLIKPTGAMIKASQG